MTASTPQHMRSDTFESAAWRRLIERALDTAPWDKLIAKTADGVSLQPLYLAADAPFEPSPITRGLAAPRPWQVRQSISQPDPVRANAQMIEELERGASALELVVDPTGAQGIAISDGESLAEAIRGVLLDIAPISLVTGAHTHWAGELLAGHLEARNLPHAAVAFGVDPIGALMRAGAADTIEEAARFAARVARDFPNASALRVDVRPIHEAGGSEGQEIGAALAIAIAYLRALEREGAPLDDVNRLFEFSLSCGADIFVEAAKLRALRLCWARILDSIGAARGLAAIHASTSQRMLTRVDPWTNILRATAGAVSAALGGAQAITVAPFTHALGPPTAFARRIARNTQLVLIEEAHLAHVADPAGGAWFVERLTNDLAEAGWAFMQRIETEGGALACLQRGWLQEEIAAMREARQRQFALRKETITGVTDFPLLNAAPPEVESDDWRANASAPAPTRALACAPLSAMRWAAPFEALRERAEQVGAAPIFFATLGALAEFSARAQFARNLFAVGGLASFAPEAVYAHAPQIAADFAASGCIAAVIVGADTAYDAHAAETAAALKAAGARWVILAGRPGDHEQAWRGAGVDQFIFAGRDALDMIERVHAGVGISA